MIFISRGINHFFTTLEKTPFTSILEVAALQALPACL
jgi:hypothetical protein